MTYQEAIDTCVKETNNLNLTHISDFGDVFYINTFNKAEPNSVYDLKAYFVEKETKSVREIDFGDFMRYCPKDKCDTYDVVDCKVMM